MDTLVAMAPFGLADSTCPHGIADLLTDRVQRGADNPAIFYGDQVLSYGQLSARMKSIAIALTEAGIKCGDKVGVFFPNHPDLVASFFAVVRIGGTVVPINPLLKADEIAHILADSDAKAVIAHQQLARELEATLPRLNELQNVFVLTYQNESSIDHQLADKSDAMGGSEATEAIQKMVASSGKVITVLDELELRKKEHSLDLNARQIAEHGILISHDQLAVLVYTSGTTGHPKGAMLSHGNLLAAVEMKRSILDFRDTDRILAVLPLCHIYGLAVVMLGMISQGGAMVICEKFETISVLDAIEKNRVTIIPAVPAMYQFMAMELEKNPRDLSALRYGLCGAAPLEAELLNRLDAALGVPVLEGYALTETACIATITPLSGPRKPGSVGPKVPGVELYVVDNKFSPLPRGRANVGQVAVRGPNVMSGYYKQKEASDDCIKDGLFLTGDLGWFDEDEYLHISGRTKELIIRGGQNIYPREVETAIMRMESILEVAVIGIPDKYMGERVKAVVVVKPGNTVTEDQVKEFCTNCLAPYKVPRIVEFSDGLPRNSTGKVLKRMLL
ncbi:MAG: AMP-binding protein [Candidatus Melainabacteria bacterium]|nr:AMP-binding protein [Candidatus Melainabacteria bacterium]